LAQIESTLDRATGAHTWGRWQPVTWEERGKSERFIEVVPDAISCLQSRIPSTARKGDEPYLPRFIVTCEDLGGHRIARRLTYAWRYPDPRKGVPDAGAFAWSVSDVVGP
jgi:hypothetical protein